MIRPMQGLGESHGVRMAADCGDRVVRHVHLGVVDERRTADRGKTQFRGPSDFHRHHRLDLERRRLFLNPGAPGMY